MPVQVWHRHTFTPTGKKAAVSTSKTFITDTGKNNSKDCKICAHHYVDYYDDQQQIQIDPLISLLLNHGIFTSSFLEFLSCGLSNKGPPAYFSYKINHC
jgi:hypothetical protein